MKFTDIYTLIKTQYLSGDSSYVPVIAGSPGCGKSALVKALGRDPDLGFEYFDDLNFAQLDIPDVAGLALIGDLSSDVLKFKKSPLLAPFQDSRKMLLCIEEAFDASIPMQNLMRRLVWDRKVNNLVLGPNVFMAICTNRSVDKSGAGRPTTKLLNVISYLTMESNLEAWVSWAIEAGVDPVLIQFLRFKPDLLDKFDPNELFSPTPRQWEFVSRIVPTLRQDLFFAAVASRVGDGPASEYTAFRKIYESLISFDEVVANPEKAKIPTDRSAQYAIVGSLSTQAKANNVDAVATYINRMEKDFGVMFWHDIVKRTPAVKGSKAFVKWIRDAGNVLLG